MKKLTMFLLVFMMLGASLAYAQAVQFDSRVAQIEHSQHEDVAYDAWILAVRYNFEPIAEEYEVNFDPKMRAIASLRGDGLRYFLDFMQAINQVQTSLFLPLLPDSVQAQGLTISEHRELLEIVTANVFLDGTGIIYPRELSERDQAYVMDLQTLARAIVDGTGDEFFTAEYLKYRAELKAFIGHTGAELLNPSPEYLDAYLEYFDIENEEALDLELNGSVQTFHCYDTVHTIDNWPAKDSTFAGETGWTWYEAKASDQTDCDIWVSYYMGPALHYGRISAGTSPAQCVLSKFSQLRADWTGNFPVYFNNVQYGKTRVTFPWPFGCSTTGEAVRAGTKWRP